MNVLTSPITLYIGLGAAFVAIAILLGILLPSRSDDMAKILNTPLGLDRTKFASRRLKRVFLAIQDGLRSEGATQGPTVTVDAHLELAGWPLRASEFTILRALAAATGMLVGAFVLYNWFLAIALAGLGWYAPKLVLSRQADRRSEEFLEQLPDTLNLLAASLEAGHGILQGMDAVVAESPQPTSSEFARALAEIRLGRPVHDALTSMADRIGGDEFRWSVLAMNVQRDVGGNLSVLLKTISETLREREQLRRQVKVLSAEGRISAVVLGALPFVLGLYMAVVNPTYMNILIGTGTGRILMFGSLALMGLGALWLRRLVRIEV